MLLDVHSHVLNNSGVTLAGDTLNVRNFIGLFKIDIITILIRFRSIKAMATENAIVPATDLL